MKERGKDPPHPTNTAQLQLISQGIFILHSSAHFLSWKEGLSRHFLSYLSSYVCKEEKESALRFFYGICCKCSAVGVGVAVQPIAAQLVLQYNPLL